MSLRLSKERYLASEPVFAHVSIRNTGGEDLKLNRWPRCIVKDQTGKIFPGWAANVVTSHPHTDTLILKPHHIDSSYVIDLVSGYGEGKLELNDLHTKHFFPPGSYTAQALYTILGSDVIGSFTVEFSIVEPQGLEHDAHELLVRATDLELLDRKPQAGALLDSLAQYYPNSAYHALGFTQHFEMYEWSDDEREQRSGYAAAMRLIETHPENEASDLALTYIMIRAPKVTKTVEARKQLLLKISHDYPGSNVGKRALMGLTSHERRN